MNKGKMTEEEYLKRVGRLFEDIRDEMPQASDQEIFEAFRAREFDLMLDFRLGEDFPKDRREALKKVQSQIMHRFEELQNAIMTGGMAPSEYAEAVQLLVKTMKEEYEAILDAEEMEALCGEGFPGIPLDLEIIGHS